MKGGDKNDGTANGNFPHIEPDLGYISTTSQNT
jgi:hypothetical protein